MTTKSKQFDKYTILNFTDTKLTAQSAPEVKSEIILLSKDPKHLIFDMSGVDYIDSAGLSCFLIANRIMKEQKSCFVICNISDKINNLIRLTKLNEVLLIIDSLEEAVDYVLLNEIEKNL